MDKIEKLPPGTVERLSKYRRLLLKYRDLEEAHIFSHKLADLFNITPVRVRRDLMLTVPPDSAVQNALLLQQAGIKVILNFTSVHLDVTPEIYLKNYDIITSLEENAFFI